MKYVLFLSTLALIIVAPLASLHAADAPSPSATASESALPDANSAWRAGQPRACLKNGDALLGWFKDRAKDLGADGKLRVLIIGDSLSDGGYHWSHYFRRDLQAAYGNGGPGNITAMQAGAAPGQGSAPNWLFSPADFTSYVGAKRGWRSGWGGRGDIWPYVGWNGNFLAASSPEAEYFLEAEGSRFTIVRSIGSFTTFDGQSIENRAGGCTATFDKQTKTLAPSAAGDPLDIELTRFDAPEGRHQLHLGAITGGTFYFHGVLVEKAAPGVVVYNISHGGYWAHDYIWRQPGFEKILVAMNPDLTIMFLSKPESGGSADISDTSRNPETEMLLARVGKALPQTKFLFMINWKPRDGQSGPDAQTVKDRIAWYESHHYPYLNLGEGLDSSAMKRLGWFNDNIHLAQPGGQGIGQAIAKLFLPDEPQQSK